MSGARRDEQGGTGGMDGWGGAGDGAQLPPAPGLRGVLGSLSSGAGDGGGAQLRVHVRGRVRRRRLAKAGATGVTACVVVGGLALGVADAAPWRDHGPVPAVTTPTASPRTPTPTPAPTPTTSSTTQPAPQDTATDGADSTVMAPFDDGFVPHPFAESIPSWDMWPYTPVADRAAYTCGASEDVLQQAVTAGQVDVEVTDGITTVPYEGEGGGEQTVMTLRVTDASDGAFDGLHAMTVALVQDGRVVGFLDDLDGPSFEPGGTASVQLPVLTTNPRAWCTKASWSYGELDGAPYWHNAPDAYQADATYRAYVVAEPTCPEKDAEACVTARTAHPAVASEPFTIVVAHDGRLSMALDD